MRATGRNGRLVVGYNEAAALGEWSLDLDDGSAPRRYVLDAEVKRSSAFWLTQEPMALELAVGESTWRWVPVFPELVGGRIALVVEGVPKVER